MSSTKTCPHLNNNEYTSLEIEATSSWQDTGISITAGLSYTLTYQYGKWTALPSSNNGKPYDANGCPGLIAPKDQTSYPIPGANMGALVGKIGESGAPFLVGNGPLTLTPSATETGNLYLCINDDLTGAYGSGLKDNEGAVSVLIHEYKSLPIPPFTDAENALIQQFNNNGWTKAQALADLTTHLQIAVEVELATIPVYLYSYYSINRTPSGFPTTAISRFADEAGATIMSVAVEEMLHMSLAANILFSLGKQPELYLKSPSPFPSNLPGHAKLNPDSQPMAIPLKKFSLEQLTNFLYIEYPSTADAPPEGSNWKTIGQIYSYIRCLIQSKHISHDDFGHAPHQIQPENYSPNSIDTAYPNAEFQLKCPVPVGQDKSASSVAQYASREDSHSGNAALITIDSKQKALEAIATIDAQGEGFAASKYDDESQTELSHYYRFLTLQSNLLGYDPDPSSENLAPVPKPLPLAEKPYSAADLATFVFNFPDNPVAANYPNGRREVADLISGLYQYMLIMTESIYLQDPAKQKVYFNQSLHRSMIWILDKIIQQMRQINLSDIESGMDSYRFAPTFENINLGPRTEAFSTLKQMAENINSLYGNEKWYTNGLQYYIQMISDLPDVSSLWENLSSSASCDVSKYEGAPKFPENPPETLFSGEDRHACMGLNSCKNQGRTRDNSCAGQGYCSTALAYNFETPTSPLVSDHTCHVKNDCAGQGGCGLYGTALEQNRPGANECKTLGSCATPINAERFSTDGPNRDQSVWVRAREVFQQTKWPELQKKHNLGDLPQVPGTSQAPDIFKYGPTIEWIEDYSDQGMTACGASGMSGAGSCA